MVKNIISILFISLFLNSCGQNDVWTGYVYPDDKFWPIEKPTWTAGAVLLAADAVYKFTTGSELFSKAWA